ncbi:CHAD domain-containing protein [Halomonas beimenensis]|uniref:CHAD domain containing protein n=1 Tax=Halomonas beimenensis TaxID=475662 RepID=A0A291P8V2_9GAMM|nr:CHAD domain-containing protein [Halomonas beimenensis]ATJ83299.1 CHAD domain containing protein [Halomonas beimenensis]
MPKPLKDRRLSRAVGDGGLEMLAEARQARPRVDDPEDLEGLHDFRVALRRLRSWLQAYRDYPGIKVPKPQRRRLRDLAKATNAARDGEVMLAWLEAELPGLPAAERGAAHWWRQRLTQGVDLAYAEARRHLEEGFPQLEENLGRSLSTLAQARSKGPRFGEATARELEALRATLVREVAAIASVEDREALHRPRITGKRIRYLLRPWKDEDAVFKEAEKAMKAFQDAFGVLHDDLVRETALQAAAAEHAGDEVEARLIQATRGETASAAAPRHLRGFLGLARGNRRRLLGHYEAAVGNPGGVDMAALTARLDAVVAAMRGKG